MGEIDFEKLAKEEFEGMCNILEIETRGWENKILHVATEYLKYFFDCNEIPEIKIQKRSPVTYLDYQTRKINLHINVGKGEFLIQYSLEENDFVIMRSLLLVRFDEIYPRTFNDALAMGQLEVDSLARLGELLVALDKLFDEKEDKSE